MQNRDTSGRKTWGHCLALQPGKIREDLFGTLRGASTFLWKKRPSKCSPSFPIPAQPLEYDENEHLQITVSEYVPSVSI